MSTANQGSNLERLAAREVADCLRGLPVKSGLDISPGHELFSVLELLIPQILREDHIEWETESIDGFYVASAIKTGDGSISLMGTCILISDQSVTPFALELGLAREDVIHYLRIRLGEPGSGALGISGPGYNSRGASELLASITSRVDSVHWSYDVTKRH